MMQVKDYRKIAKKKLSKSIFDYIDGAAEDEITYRANSTSFNHYFFLTTVLQDVSKIETEFELLKTKFAMPLMFAPTAFHKLVEPQKGEISTAIAAKTCQLPMVISSMSSVPFEDIIQQSNHDDLWLQIYLYKDKAITSSLIETAHNIGIKALMITVGVPYSGIRYRDQKNQFKVPDSLFPKHYQTSSMAMSIGAFAAQYLNPGITWDDIVWLKKQTHLPIILKGILNPLDAEKAYHAGIQGIVVSNHGGRQLDCTIPSILALPDIIKIINGRIPVLLDGGIRRASDIFKAYALGADAVMIGRPVLWALAVDGQSSLMRMVMSLKNDFETIMGLTGCTNLSDVRAFQENIKYVKI